MLIIIGKYKRFKKLVYLLFSATMLGLQYSINKPIKDTCEMFNIAYQHQMYINNEHLQKVRFQIDIVFRLGYSRLGLLRLWCRTIGDNKGCSLLTLTPGFQRLVTQISALFYADIIIIRLSVTLFTLYKAVYRWGKRKHFVRLSRIACSLVN